MKMTRVLSHFWVLACLLLLAACSAAIISGCKAKSASGEAQAQATQPAADTPSHVAAAAAKASGSGPTGDPNPMGFTTTGPLVAADQADISAERDGRVVQVAVQIGDRVKSGQLLALLDDREPRAQLELQKANLALAKADMSEWEAEEKSDGADLRRADAMLREKIMSQENWEHVKYKLDEAIAGLAHQRDAVAAAQANLQIAAVKLDQSRIVAPFAGVVGRSSARRAQQVKAGDVLFWITAEEPLRVLFTVPEAEMARFTVGARLELRTAAYPELRQTARILRVSPVVDPASGSVQVIGQVVHPSHLLKPGMSMQVRLAP